MPQPRPLHLHAAARLDDETMDGISAFNLGAHATPAARMNSIPEDARGSSSVSPKELTPKITPGVAMAGAFGSPSSIPPSSIKPHTATRSGGVHCCCYCRHMLQSPQPQRPVSDAIEALCVSA